MIMAERQKSADDGFQYFKNFLSDKKNKKLILMLKGILPEFGLGLARSSVFFLRVKGANANSHTSFEKAWIDAEVHHKDSFPLVAPLCLFFLRGYATLEDFLDSSDPKIPENLAEQQALRDLLQFLSNENDQSCLLEDKGKCKTESEVSLATRLAQHLLVPLVPNKTFVSDSCPGLQLEGCCPVEQPIRGGDTSFEGDRQKSVAGKMKFEDLSDELMKNFLLDKKRDEHRSASTELSSCSFAAYIKLKKKFIMQLLPKITSFAFKSKGCPNGWHGSADVLLLGDEVPLTAFVNSGVDVVSLTSDSSVRVEKNENFTAENISQITAQTIISSFVKQSQNPTTQCSLVPGVGIRSGKMIIYLYDCVEDILLTTGPLDLYAQMGLFGLNARAIIIMWLVLNHSLFSNKTPERYKGYKAAFHHVLGPVQLEAYRNESEQPFRTRSDEMDIMQIFNEENASFEDDLTEERIIQFPDRQCVSLN